MSTLNLGQHISQKFSEELEEVRRKVLQMGGIIEEQLERAIRALLDGDRELAQEVVANDAVINALEVEIDEECIRIVALRQPAATDLRLVMAVIRTINDLERMGDEIKRVAKMVREEGGGGLDDEVHLEVEHMAAQVREMLHRVLDAFARTDVRSAVAVAVADRKVDLKYDSITRQLMTYLAQDYHNIPSVLNVMWAARALERMGDRCQNIAEYVIYLVLGKDVRHSSLDEVMADLEERAAQESAAPERENDAGPEAAAGGGA